MWSIISVLQRPPKRGNPEDKLAKKVEFELYSTKAFSLNTLQIHSLDGTVTLAGSVSSRAEKLLAEKIAQTVNGVRKVVNNLNVIGEDDRGVSQCLSILKLEELPGVLGSFFLSFPGVTYTYGASRRLSTPLYR